MEDTEDSHQEVDYGRYEESRGHETPDVAVICDESVDELADSIDEEQSRSYKTELSCRKHALVDKRLLHHAQTQTAHIIKAVGHRDAPECLSPQRSVGLCLIFLRNLVHGWLAYPEV